jgi:hypothetical protein
MVECTAFGCNARQAAPLRARRAYGTRTIVTSHVSDCEGCKAAVADFDDRSVYSR